MNITDLLPFIGTFIAGLGLNAFGSWIFGGRQNNKNTVDNDSHQREKEFFEMVEDRTEKETNKVLKRVTRCAKRCQHSVNCPVLIWCDYEHEDDDQK